jgi:hypothetical protein
MHCDKETGVTRYVKLMLNSKFHVSNLMNSKDFLKYLSVRGFSVTEKELEYMHL